jgi:Uma2 family endonuclease
MVDTLLPDMEAVDSIPAHVSEEEYMARYAEKRYEWVNGALIKMSPNSVPHNKTINFIVNLFEAFFHFKPVGIVVSHSIVMRLPHIRSNREPDAMVILGENQANLTLTYMNGPADIVIEIVSPESIGRDYTDKLLEYAKGGVPEYWILDQVNKQQRFLRLGEDGIYALQTVDTDGNYRTPLLPGFTLPVSRLWQEPLPSLVEVVELARTMIAAMEAGAETAPTTGEENPGERTD